MPARRPGVRAQKSASQRLWACSPAQRSSRSWASAGGAWVTSAPPGKNGGIVFGKMTSAAMPSASRSRSAPVGVPVALPEVTEQVGEHDLVAVDPGVELVVVPRREVVAVLVDLAAAVAVGGDDEVAVVGVHGSPPRGPRPNGRTLEPGWHLVAARHLADQLRRPHRSVVVQVGRHQLHADGEAGGGAADRRHRRGETHDADQPEPGDQATDGARLAVDLDGALR